MDACVSRRRHHLIIILFIFLSVLEPTTDVSFSKIMVSVALFPFLAGLVAAGNDQ